MFSSNAKAFVSADKVFDSQCEVGKLWTAQDCAERGEVMLRYASYAE